MTLRLRTTNACGQPVTAVSNGVAVQIQPPVDVDAGPDKEILAGTSVRAGGPGRRHLPRDLDAGGGPDLLRPTTRCGPGRRPP